MSSTDRQNRLLVAEDWKRIYQSFRNADFQSYDFDNLRRVMIQYIRENYPEDFNDYIESSEYLALIDLIAFLGQSISFRIDLNARDNFLELSERRESVIRLARLLSYNPKRNIAASGLLKFNSVKTTQRVLDSNGRNLSGQSINWNDSSNSNWYDQFIKIINAALPNGRQFGNPDDAADIYGIPSEQYRFNAANTNLPIYSFSKPVDGRNITFEIVSTVFKDANEIYEEPPKFGNQLAFVYRNDGKGNGSANSGFFLHFRQGNLNQGNFTITQPSSNESVDVDAAGINNTDIWLYQLDETNTETTLWTPVPSLEGNNVIYNSLNKSIKNIYGVVSRTNDKASLVFSDGTFGNIPRGTFKVYYRSSNGQSYTINPRDIRNVSISLPYYSAKGQIETLTLSLSLQSSVGNSSPAETNDSIKTNAPATYYTQNRMITAEDYNISPLSVNQEIVKVKAVNRSASGISRYFDLVDPTGKYSKTNLFADDGALYKEEFIDNFRFTYLTRTDIEGIIYNQLADVMQSVALRDFYYSKFFKILTDTLNVSWYNKTTDINMSTGYIGDTTDALPYKIGGSTSTNLKYVTVGSLIRFEAPTGKFFDRNNNNALISVGTATKNYSKNIWVKVISISGDGTAGGTGVLNTGMGPVVLNDVIPSTAILSQVIPVWRTVLDTNVITSMVDLVFSNKPFGLRYDIDTKSWKLIFESNINNDAVFSLGKQGDVSNQQLDSSWLILFTTDTESYTVKYRQLRYIFESDKQIRFYFDASHKIFDIKSNTAVKDKIKILSINTQPDSTSPFTYDRDWEITNEFRGLDGYIDTKKIEVTFSDSDDDSVVDNPDIFDEVVDAEVSPLSKYVVLERYEIAQGQEDYKLFDNSNNTVLITGTESDISNISTYTDGQYFYFTDTNVVKKLDKLNALLIPSLDYKLFVGRKDIKFQYIHNANYEHRIDPGITNINDVYILTKQYDKQFRQWISGAIANAPLPQSTDYLYNLLSPTLNNIKSISDEIIYHPVNYKILFGQYAAPDLQATFKIVKNNGVVVSDNDVKSAALSAITDFFALDNWDFGDSFHFSELTTYVMNRLTPNIVNFIIVPKKGDLTFGSLFEIRAEKDQIFISGATIDDIEVISAISASKIKSSGNIAVTQNTINSQNITSTGSV